MPSACTASRIDSAQRIAEGPSNIARKPSPDVSNLAARQAAHRSARCSVAGPPRRGPCGESPAASRSESGGARYHGLCEIVELWP